MFITFAYSTYYPNGGWGDFSGAFHTLDAAIAHLDADTYSDYKEIVSLDALQEIKSWSAGRWCDVKPAEGRRP